MKTQTKINAGIIATLITLISSFTYIGLPKDAINYQEPNYYCLNLSIKMHCNSLSAYYELENGKCINKDFGNKLCKSGWKEIPKFPIEVPSANLGNIHCTKDGCNTI